MNSLYWIVGGLTVLSGFFSLNGFALRSSRRGPLEEAFKGPNRHKRLETLGRHLKELRLTCTFCRTLSNLLLVIVLLLIFDSQMRFWSVCGAVATAGVIIAIFGVAIPHAWASYAGEKVLAKSLGVLMFFRCAFWPVTRVMMGFDLPIRRLVGAGDETTENGETAKQEILQVASDGQAEGTVEPEELEMIESVMEFSQTRAGEIMTPRTDIFALPVDTPLTDAIEQLVDAGHTRIPVFEGDLDHIVGILYAKDTLRYVAAPEPVDIRSILRKCYFVPETKPLDDLLKEFKLRKVHMALVLDEYGGTAGLVTIEDVVEEIVGDIADEYDPTATPQVKRIDERTAEVDGRSRIDDLNDELSLKLPEDEDYDTIAGFVFSELGYIPVEGETLEARGAKITILAADERKITRLRIELLSDARQGQQ